MPVANVNGTTIRYEIDGEDADSPTVLLSNSLASNLTMWDPQGQLLDHFFDSLTMPRAEEAQAMRYNILIPLI